LVGLYFTSIPDMTSDSQDGGHDVISCRKMLPSGECIPSIRLSPTATLQHMQQRPPAAC